MEPLLTKKWAIFGLKFAAFLSCFLLIFGAKLVLFY
jgi:hypothetical protein